MDDDEDVDDWEDEDQPSRARVTFRVMKKDEFWSALLHAVVPCARFPSLFVFVPLLVVVLVVCFCFTVNPLRIEASFDSFLKTDVDSYIRMTAFDAAVLGRGSGRRLQGAPMLNLFDVYLIYELEAPNLNITNGILNTNALRAIAGFEQSMRNLPKWKDLCGRTLENDRTYCDPGSSFANFALASQTIPDGSVVPTNLTADGQSWGPIPIAASLSLVEGHQGMPEALLPRGFQTDTPQPSTDVVRSLFRFTLPYATSSDVVAEARKKDREQTEEWAHFVQTTLMPHLQEGIGGSRDEEGTGAKIHVFYDGSYFREAEVLEVLWNDVAFAGCSFTFVICYLLFHTRSLLQSLMGVTIAVSAVPLAYALLALMGSNEASFASFLAVFLIIGFGADTILIYTDYWRDSANHFNTDEERLAWTYVHGGIASIATTGTTALSFLANLASVIRALRQFGFFMGICVLLAWLLISLIYVPLCVLDEKRFRRCRVDACVQLNSLDGLSQRARFFGAWTFHLHRWRCAYFSGPALTLLACLIVSGANINFDVTTPSLFAEEHNRQMVEKASLNFVEANSVFTATFKPPPLHLRVCHDFSHTGPGNEKDDCVVAWCDVDAGVQGGSNADAAGCPCFRRFTGECTASLRIVGPSKSEEIVNDVYQRFLATKGPEQSLSASGEFHRHPPMLLQEWVTGASELQDVSEISVPLVQTDTPTPCGWEDICFCSLNVCSMNDMEGWSDAGTFQASRPSPPPPARRLQELSQVEAARVSVVFGIGVDFTMQLLGEVDLDEAWNFLDGFDITSPHTQRSIYLFCEGIPDELRVQPKFSWCWMEEFKKCLDSLGIRRFPVLSHNFNNHVDVCRDHMQNYERYVWKRDGEVRAMYATFLLNVRRNVNLDVAFELLAAWNDYFSKTVAQLDAFHVSQLWVDAESKERIEYSVALTIVILLVLAFIGMMTFTLSVALSIFVVIATLAVMCALFFFVLIIMDWSFGMIEGISVIYFIGYALTYSLHVAHVFSGNISGELPPKHAASMAASTCVRYRRVNLALTSIGGATLGSGITTAGASFFLVFCRLSVFNRLGSMCLVVTLGSIFIALVPLPAALLSCGPVRPGQCSCDPQDDEEDITPASSTTRGHPVDS